MIRKGERTKKMIIEKTSKLLNTQGYLATPVSDVMKETGLEKGGIYNHFKSKTELSLHAFQYAINEMGKNFRVALADKKSATQRLYAILDTFFDLANGHPLPGGCPIMNAAIESDDAHPELRAETEKAMNQLYQMIQSIFQNGIKKGEFCPTLDTDEFSTIFISTIEGALMMTKLYNDPVYIKRAIRFLKSQVSSIQLNSG
ncbi:TetR/AcrR family transcriptional regulator [Alkalihalobacillus sp. BA299]|uniref:TetR/AcrR family transcriptional regulator n=1 Tax=Alkalihalobacillus sp. BA299 TaxID=2815938 RepID=UPI001AD9A951|nr:TetR/AcrR family transcriptional regulator [Alkalihalobacillus sp. BA299]